MKKFIYLSTLIILTSFTVQLKQNQEIYEYNTKKFYERIELSSSYKFKYENRFHSSKYILNGNYKIIGDSLILDSSPQRDKIIVREQKKGNKNNFRFCVTDKLGTPFNYTLFAITKINDTIKIENQWHKSKIKIKELSGFYIIDSKGLKTPLYKIKGLFTNYFEIQMETNRVFDNEIWIIKNDKITPIGMNGEVQKYSLVKK